MTRGCMGVKVELTDCLIHTVNSLIGLVAQRRTNTRTVISHGVFQLQALSPTPHVHKQLMRCITAFCSLSSIKYNLLHKQKEIFTLEAAIIITFNYLYDSVPQYADAL